MSSTIVLLVGKRRVDAKKLVDEDVLELAERRQDVLLLQWRRDVEDLLPPGEAGEEIVDVLSADVLRWHRDERGVLVVPMEIADLGGAYAEIVAAHGARGRWLPNFSREPGADPMRDLRAEIPVPDVPKSRKVELFVMAPGRAVRGSTRMECRNSPSGVANPGAHCGRMGLSLKPATDSHRSPPSTDRNNPAGALPAYQTPGSEAWPGVTQNTRSTARAVSPGSDLRNAGGCVASFQVRPRSFDRNTVGPRCPVFAAINSTLGSRGSATM
jgi:hypothetical protein